MATTTWQPSLFITGAHAAKTIRRESRKARIARIFKRRAVFGYCADELCGGNRAVVFFKGRTPVCARHWSHRRRLAREAAQVESHPAFELRYRKGPQHVFIATIGQPGYDDVDELDVWACDAVEARAKAEAELCMYDESCVVQSIRQSASL